MLTIPLGRRGPARKLKAGDEKALVDLWLNPENNRTELAKTFGLSRYGARLIVERFLRENAPASQEGDTDRGLSASATEVAAVEDTPR